MLIATSPMVSRPAAGPDDPERRRTAAIATRDEAANMREDDAEVEETKQISKPEIKRTVVYLTHPPGYHV